MDQEKGKYTLGQNLAYVLRGVRRYDPWLFVFFAASTIVTAMLPFLGMYGPKWLIDELTGAQRPLALGGIILGLFLLTALGQWAALRRLRYALYQRALRLHPPNERKTPYHGLSLYRGP